MRILISGGGTGGHIYPALAVAHALRDWYDAELMFLGDENGLEREIVPREGIRFVGVTAGKLRRYISLRTFTDLTNVPVGMRQAHEVVREFQPHAAFTSGGYASVPAGYAARRVALNVRALRRCHGGAGRRRLHRGGRKWRAGFVGGPERLLGRSRVLCLHGGG